MIKKIGSILFFACLVSLFCCPDNVHALNPGTNITVCVADNLNIFDPAWPDINFGVSGNPFYYYDVMIQKWNPASGTWNGIYDSGAVVPPSTNPGNYTHYIPPGTLPMDGSGYAARVSVYGYYGDWTPQAVGTFVLNRRDGECGTSNGNSYCPYSLPSLQYPELCLKYSLLNPSAVSGSGAAGTTWSWTCSGSGGGASPTCTAQAKAIETPNCGSVMSATVCPGSTITDTTPGLCTISANPPHVTGDGSDTNPWTWTCTAACGQTALDKVCSRSFTERIAPTCGDASGQNYCYKDTQPDSDNLCSPSSLYQAGSLENNYTEWTWNCNGICPTSTTVCHAGNSRSCGWIETN